MPGSDSFEILTTKRLNHLPLVSACMRYLEIDQIIDETVPSHKLNCVSTGERGDSEDIQGAIFCGDEL